MHTKPETHEDILRLWTGPKHLIKMGDDIGVPWRRARMWRDRNSIPPKYWVQVIEAVRRRFDIPLTVEDLAGNAAYAHFSPEITKTERLEREIEEFRNEARSFRERIDRFLELTEKDAGRERATEAA